MKYHLHFVLLATTGCVSLKPLTMFVERPADHLVVVAEDRTIASGILVDETFKIDGFAVDPVERGGFIQTKSSHGRGGYAYAMKKGTIHIDARCAVFGGSPYLRKLSCECRVGDRTLSTVSAGARSTNGAYEGELRLGDEHYPLQSVGEPERLQQFLHPGFTIGTPLFAAVQVGMPGEVWLNPDIYGDARAGTVCAAVGLMLYRPGHAKPTRVGPRRGG